MSTIKLSARKTYHRCYNPEHKVAWNSHILSILFRKYRFWAEYNSHYDGTFVHKLELNNQNHPNHQRIGIDLDRRKFLYNSSFELLGSYMSNYWEYCKAILHTVVEASTDHMISASSIIILPRTHHVCLVIIVTQPNTKGLQRRGSK
jgi:hypothetical protein